MAKIFISWSGDVSLQIAKALHEWLPDVLQAVRPWMSTDIPPGAPWIRVLLDELAASKLGILCLTRENLTAPWLLFEAGALAKQVTVSGVIPYRFRLKEDEVAPPLSQFQSIGADKTGTLDLLNAINKIIETPLKDERIENGLDAFWPRLNRRLSKIETHDRKELERLRQCETDLHKYPRGPAVEASLITYSFIQDIADEFHDRTLILDLVNSANRLRHAADPGDPSVTVVRHGLLVMNDTAYAAWQSVFREARLNSPRMLAAILMVLPIDTDHLKQQRDLLLNTLKTSSRIQATIN